MSSHQKYEEFARRVKLFNGLSPEEVHKIVSRGMTIHIAKGETLFYQGTIGNKMYVVLGGVIGLYDGKEQIASLRTGAMFGEMALIEDAPRSATAVAEEASRLFVLDERTFNKLLTKRVSIRILLNVVGTLSNRLRDMNARYTQLKERTGG